MTTTAATKAQRTGKTQNTCCCFPQNMRACMEIHFNLKVTDTRWRQLKKAFWYRRFGKFVLEATIIDVQRTETVICMCLLCWAADSVLILLRVSAVRAARNLMLVELLERTLRQVSQLTELQTSSSIDLDAFRCIAHFTWSCRWNASYFVGWERLWWSRQPEKCQKRSHN